MTSYARVSAMWLWVFGLIVLGLAVQSTPAQASQRLERTITVDGLSRRYIVWLPNGYQRPKPMPVVLVFTGGGQPVTSMEDNADLHDAKAASNFVIVYGVGIGNTYNVGGY